MHVPAYTRFILLSILFIFASINFTKTAFEIVDNSKRLDEIGQEVGDLEVQKEDLEKSVEYKKTDAYVEEKARNDLNLIRPGEKVYVIPQEIKSIDLDSKVLGEMSEFRSNREEDKTENIDQWIALFIR